MVLISFCSMPSNIPLLVRVVPGRFPLSNFRAWKLMIHQLKMIPTWELSCNLYAECSFIFHFGLFKFHFNPAYLIIDPGQWFLFNIASYPCNSTAHKPLCNRSRPPWFRVISRFLPSFQAHIALDTVAHAVLISRFIPSLAQCNGNYYSKWQSMDSIYSVNWWKVQKVCPVFYRLW